MTIRRDYCVHNRDYSIADVFYAKDEDDALDQAIRYWRNRGLTVRYCDFIAEVNKRR